MLVFFLRQETHWDWVWRMISTLVTSWFTGKRRFSHSMPFTSLHSLLKGIKADTAMLQAPDAPKPPVFEYHWIICRCSRDSSDSSDSEHNAFWPTFSQHVLIEALQPSTLVFHERFQTWTIRMVTVGWHCCDFVMDRLWDFCCFRHLWWSRFSKFNCKAYMCINICIYIYIHMVV